LTLTEDSVVWDEIKITDEQLGKVTRLKTTIVKHSRKVRNEARDQRRAQEQAATASGQPVDPEVARAARDAERAAVSEDADVVEQQTNDSLKKILKPAQFQRVQQIDIQEAGPLVVARPDVAKALGITTDQQDKINKILSGMQDALDKSRRDAFAFLNNNNNNAGGPGGGGPGGGPGGGGPGGGGPGGGGRGGRGGNNNMTPEERQARQDQFDQARAKSDADRTNFKERAIKMIGDLLTKAQKTKFAALQGKSFDLTLLNDGQGPNNPWDPTRRRGGPPGGRGGPGGGPPGGGGAPATTANATAATPGTAGAATTGTTGTSTTATATASAKTATKTQTKGATGTGTVKGTATKPAAGR
jgi:hypothetical protein